MTAFRAALLVFVLPFLVAATTEISGQVEIKGLWVIAAVSTGTNYAIVDTFTRTGNTTLDTGCAGGDTCEWDEYCSSGDCYETSGTTLIEDPANGVTRRALNGTATTLSQYVGAQYVGALSGLEAPGVVLRADDAGASPTGATNSHKFYVLRVNGTAWYEIRACQNVADCETLATIDNANFGGALNTSDSIGLAVSADTGNSIAFTAYKWESQVLPTDFTLWAASAGTIWTVCASGCDQVWTVAPASSTKGTADAGLRGGVYNGNTGANSAWDNWVFGDTVVGPPPPPSMSLSTSTLSPASAESAIPTDTVMTIANAGGGMMDWSVSRTSIDDCNGATAGGADWVSLSPTSGTDVISGSPQTITVDYSDDTCTNAESPHVAEFEFTSSDTTNDPLTLTITRTTTTAGGGGNAPDVSLVSSQAWGHRHPDCSGFGDPSTWTSCGSNTIAGGTTYDGCNISAGVTFAGDNITLECVNWGGISDGTQTAIACSDSGGCTGIHIDKVTMTGSQVPQFSDPTGGAFLRGSTAYGSGGNHSMLVEKSIIRGNRVGVLLGGGRFDKDAAAIEPGYAFVMRESIIHEPMYSSTDVPEHPNGEHSELIAHVETSDGILFEDNLLYCRDGYTCNTGVLLSQPHSGGTLQNISLIGNSIYCDSTGICLYFDHQSNLSSNCTTGITFTDNEIFTDGSLSIFGEGLCSSVSARGTCSGNTVDGSALTASGCSP